MSQAPSPAIAALAAAIRGGERRALARAITLVESSRADHRGDAEALLAALLSGPAQSLRLGISGVPGVGKSTFIETLGLRIVGAGHRLAVLAVDPSSKRSGGSILGDKTRMGELARHPAAFIRPSPAGRTLGGVARRTRDTMLLCEAAGFDTVIVETVGIGQSETAVADMVDLFLLLLLPGGGDELQGIKKGVVELADMILVNKADGDFASAAQRAVADYRSALRLLRPAGGGAPPEIAAVSARSGEGIERSWSRLRRRHAERTASGALAARRAEQALAALWAEIGESLVERLKASPAVARRLPAIEAAVTAGRQAPTAAARALLAAFLGEAAGEAKAEASAGGAT